MTTWHPQVSHFSVDFFADEEGWWIPRCNCGFVGSPCPDAEDAVDVLMDHAYEVAVMEAASVGSRGD